MSICKSCEHYHTEKAKYGGTERTAHKCGKYPDTEFFGDISGYVIKEDCGCFSRIKDAGGGRR